MGGADGGVGVEKALQVGFLGGRGGWRRLMASDTHAHESANTPIGSWHFLAIKHAVAESLLKHTHGRLFHSIVVGFVVVCRFFEGIDLSR